MAYLGRKFHFLCRLSLILVFSLFLVGSVVRATGSGMGCPDWPKCFGRWIPPTSVSDLPVDYQARYAKHGYDHLPFDPVKTWTEYLNRLLGAVVGVSILATFISSLSFRKTRFKVTFWAGASVILVGLAGWLGAIVVKSNLSPLLVTLHMAVGLSLIAALILALHYTKDYSRMETPSRYLLALMFFCVLITLIQFFLGTQVREGVDVLMAQGLCRCHWIFKLGPVFYIHRSFSWAVLGTSLIIIWKLKSFSEFRPLLITWNILLGLEIVLGLSLAYLGFPIWAQPLHLFFACLIFAVQCRLILVVRAMCAP